MQPNFPSSAIEGFSLRPIQHSDVDDWYAYLSIPQVVEHTSWSIKNSDDLRTLIGSYLSPDTTIPMRFALQDDLSGRLVGSFGLNPTGLEAETVELAYDLDPSLWGRGLASASSAALVKWACAAFGYSRILATVLDTNIRSARVLERIGFVREGSLPRYRLVRGERRDFWLYAHTAQGQRPNKSFKPNPLRGSA